jgi:hypothetical protein
MIPEQAAFLLDFCKLIQHAAEQGYTVTAGELLRTPEQQKIYVETGRSKTMNSNHIRKLAGDLNIFIKGKVCSAAEIRPLGVFWESLHPKNRWGGNFKSIVDAPHFERNA